MEPKALSPAILTAIRKLDAAHAEFFAVLDREARKGERALKAGTARTSSRRSRRFDKRTAERYRRV
jgi:hypothetical protein